MSEREDALAGLLADHAWVYGSRGIACRCGDELRSRYSSRRAAIDDHVRHVAAAIVALGNGDAPPISLAPYRGKM